ncbi:unnamed protein product, partial [Rotaria sp. Silwood2]
MDVLPSVMNHKEHKLVIDAIKFISEKLNEIESQTNSAQHILTTTKPKDFLYDSGFFYKCYSTTVTDTDLEYAPENLQQQYPNCRLQHPLTLRAYEAINDETLTLTIIYNGELFSHDVIDNLVVTAQELAFQISNNQPKRIAELHFLTKQQLEIIDSWNRRQSHLPILKNDITLHKLFEEEAKLSPDKIAVVYEDVKLTYRDLNEKANRLAHYLRSISNIHPDDIIALILDKSELMIISILGAWKSGAAYVPIDPNYPDERIKFILEDTKAKIVISNMKYSSRLYSYNIAKVEIDSPIVNEVLNNTNITCNLDVITNERNLAYVIYTSGTTGAPKGVLVEHQSVVSFRNDVKYRYFSANEDNHAPEVILFLSNYVFDFSIEQIVLSILSSNTLIIVGNHFPIDESYYAYLNKNRLTYISGTPTQIEQMDLAQLKHIATVSIGGEVFSARAFERIRGQFGGKIFHVYGITETTVYNMVFDYQNDTQYKTSIGSPLSNTKGFVLNNDMQLLPLFAVGELYLAGNCLSRGYLNRPELKAERFLPNPFQTEEEKKVGKNERIYKTGDLVRCLPDGQLQYVGRNDCQVKIRGLRIELGEIEAVLSSYQGVKQCVVVVRDSKDLTASGTCRKYIIGYFVSQSILLESDIKHYMESKLPDYMVPNRLVQIENIPVNTSGKIDLKALPEVDFSKHHEESLVPPRDDLEWKILHIWSHLLGIPSTNISVHDDFFGLGGDSVLLMKVALMLSNVLSTKISVSAVFANKTIESLTTHILHGLDYNSEENNLIAKLRDDFSTNRNYVLSFAQERLLFIDQFHGKTGNNAYNIPIYLQITDNNIKRNVLHQSLRAILNRHETLRTLIEEDKSGVFYQHILKEEEIDAFFKVDEIQVTNTEQLDTELNKLVQYVFNLRKELPIKVTFYEMKNTDEDEETTLYMGIVIHHIAFDGWSLNVFWKELQTFYDYFDKDISSSGTNTISDRTLKLPELPVQYRDFALWQREYLSRTRLFDLSEFWKKKLDGYEMLNLMLDCPVRPSLYDFSGDEIPFELDEQVTKRLKALAMRLN